MNNPLKSFVEALLVEDGYKAARCLSPAFTVHDGLVPEDFIKHEIEEFRQRLRRDERKPDILVTGNSQSRYEVSVVANGLVYAADFEVDDEGLICSNGNVVECVPKLRHYQDGVDRAAAIRSHDFAVQMITPRFPVLDCHITLAPRSGLFSYLHFSSEVDPQKSFNGSLRIMMQVAGSTNVITEFPGLDKFSDWQEKEFFPIIMGNVVQIPVGKSRPWNASVWFEDGGCASIERPEPGFEWQQDKPVIKAMVTDALDNDWVVEASQ